jgi:translocator protein
METQSKNSISLILFIILIMALASLSALPTHVGDGSWYAQLIKPGFTPDNWMFALVWPILYILVAIAFWLLWNKRHEPGCYWVLTIFAAQLLVSFSWSWIFFGLHSLLFGFLWIVLLWCMIGWTVLASWSYCKKTAFLLLPYWLWVTFAGVLAATIWWMN